MIRHNYLWMCLLLLVITPVEIFAQDSDVNPPTLVEFDFSPKIIDVTEHPETVTVTAHITDDLVGFNSIDVVFRSPSGVQSQQAFTNIWYYPVPNPNDCTVEAMVEFPMFVEEGTWEIEFIWLTDQIWNEIFLDNETLTASGFPTSLVVTSNPDTTPPILKDLIIIPDSIDVSSGDSDVTFRLSVEDDLSGFNYDLPMLSFILLSTTSPSDNQSHLAYYDNLIIVSEQDGVYDVTIKIPQYSENGEWQVSGLILWDRVWNRSIYTFENWPEGIPSTFTVSSDPSDTTPPILESLSFFPTFINTSVGNQIVNVTMELEDDLSGIHEDLNHLWLCTNVIMWHSPSGGQSRGVCIYDDNQLTSGTPLSGTWEFQMFFPQYSEAGTWKVDYAYLMDRTSNRVDLSTDDLETMGFQTELVVVRPSLVSDGSIGAGGGTVQDQVFGDQAQLTLPAGAVEDDTDVAIDVFDDPLDVPLPSGFSATGSYFVNIHLTPEPDYPLPPPGMTIVLPLEIWVMPGTTLLLYRIDPDTGNLTPSISVDDLPVVGTVNPDGMSATFEGVARLSVVVDLIPSTVFIDECDSGVENHVLEDHYTISYKIAECAIGAKNHGKFVSCISKLTNGLKKQGIITVQEKGAIQSCAAQADIP